MLLNRLEEVREIAKLKRRVDVVEAENAEGKSERVKMWENSTLRLCDAAASQAGSMRGSRRETAKSGLRVAEGRAGVPDDDEGCPALLYTP